ncbi:MAG: type II secretion system secretin GspD [Deltaproteobacteria bacterium]|nr:type II secretion system secretin GspD [Deltaproteobacteria bacterium]
MKNKIKRRFTLGFYCVTGLLWLFTASSVVHGARVAGEKGVIATPKAEQRVGRPAPSKPAVKPQSRIRPVQVKEKDTPQKVSNPQKGGREEPKPETRYVTIDFDNVDIALFIKFISELTGKNFVLDKGIKGKVTIISPTKITVEEAYKVFESVLEVHGFTTVPAGSIIKIVPAIQARSKDIETRLRKEAITPEDKIVTQLIHLKYADPNELKKLFGPFISKTSVIVSYPPTGMLIVTDVLSNISRLLSIVEVIDVAGIGEEISVIPFEHATASVIAKTLTNVFQRKTTRPAKGGQAGPVIKIVPDERTNTLIILASEDDISKVKQLIELLDKETPRGKGDIHVYYLQNANAEDLSKVLTALPSDQKQETQKGKAPVISKEVRIVADKATNSLIITAKKEDYLVLEDVIMKLDIPRRMVYIEALIMEVNVDKQFDLGVEWRAGDQTGSHDEGTIGTFLGSGGMGSEGSYSNFPAADSTGTISFPSAFSVGVLGTGIKIGDAFFPTLGAVLRAYQKDADVHIISTPQILTTDNEEAQITVGENVPYITKLDTSVGTETDYTQYEYKDVGVTLKITPQINQERFVRLKIFHESKQLKKGTVAFRPTTLTRSAETTVIVKDENTVVIGGIIGESDERGNYKVPLLGDIPLLGWFFRSSSSARKQTNLFIFLTPHIIENPVEAKAIFKDRKDQMKMIEEGVVKMYEGRRKQPEDMRLADLAYTRIRLKDYEKAVEYLKKALEINPDNPYAILNMGVIYEETGEKDKAVKMYEKLISLNSDERAFTSTDPMQRGRKLTDLARDNLKNLQDSQ